MKYFGFRTFVIKWFESYLPNRKFLVCIDNVFSEARTLKYCVSQGSILGPPLFLLYVNDLPQSLSEGNSYLHPGDTCIFYQHEDVKNIETVFINNFRHYASGSYTMTYQLILVKTKLNIL